MGYIMRGLTVSYHTYHCSNVENFLFSLPSYVYFQDKHDYTSAEVLGRCELFILCHLSSIVSILAGSTECLGTTQYTMRRPCKN
jgi:hypothetical protein